MKRWLALIICAAMMVAYVPCFNLEADAATTSGKVPLHYTALGDASTAGYGMSRSAGYNKVTEGTYPALIQSALTAKGFDVTTDQLAMDGMRAEELRYLLDSSYEGDSYRRVLFADLAKYRTQFENSIRDANLITYKLGTVNFGQGAIFRVSNSAYDPAYDDADVKALVEADPDGVMADLQAATTDGGSTVDDMFAKFSIPAFDYSEYFKAAAYAYYSFCLSFDKSMEKIRALNPDAEIVVMGIGNMLGELKLKVNVSGILTDGLDIGSLYGRLFVDRANNHMIEAAAANYNMDYVSAGDAERFMDEIAAYNGDPSTISSQFKEYCDYYEEDLKIKNAVDNKLKSFLANISSSTKKTEYKNNAYKAAYDTAASALSLVAKETEAKLTTDTATFILGYKDNISDLGGIISDLEYSLLYGLRDKSADIAYNAKSGNDYKNSIAQYTTVSVSNNNPMMYNPEFSKNKNGNIFEIGRILFMIKIRVTMGNGFFQHPSANGHKQLSDMVMNACTGRIVKYPVHEQTCVQDGNSTEFWVDMAAGQCYQDQAATTPINAVDLFTKAYGHSYGKTVVTVKPKYCTDGKGKQTCSKCGDVKTVAIPGLGPDAIKLSSVTAAKKAFTAKWKKPSSAKLKKMTGYQLRYSLKSSMASSKTVKVGKTNTSKKVSSLKAKKKYYVQIRTYVTKNGKTYYSDWSAKKTVKTK